MSPFPAIFASVLLLAVPQPPSQETLRTRPPAQFACSPNDLTSYTGVVIAYTRETGRTTIRIRTDWDTTEQITLRHAGSDDPSAFYRLGGRAFTAADWTRIERSKSAVQPDMRASAWVCADGKTMIDWDVARE
jgi:hypothetical protein